MLTVLSIGFFTMLVIGVPIAFAMAGSATLALLLESHVPLLLVVQRTYAGGDSFALMAIPFFVIAGEIMTASRMTDALVELCNALLGHLRSGLAGVAVGACVVFAGISGSGSADAAAIGSVLTPQLIAKGYPRGLAAAIISTAGALGPIIPPSLLMIVYAAIAEQSVGQLFLAGIVPGLMIGIGLMGVIHAWNIRRGWEAPSGEKISPQRVGRALRAAALPLGTPVVIVVGIVGGVFTATEAGVVAAVYALLVAYFYSSMRWSDIKKALIQAGLLSSLSLFVISMAAVFGWILAREDFPSTVAGAVLSASDENAMLGAAIVIAVVLVLGFFIEVFALMIVFVPILAPIGPALGFDPIHWGLLMVMSMNVGGITPPVGTNMFISASIAKCSLAEISRYSMPLVAVHAVVVFLVLFLPGMVLWIPRAVFG